jgi:plasmid stabilization system protein ParE
MKFGGDDPAVIALIAEAVELLARHPQIGRPAEHGLRELVISRGKSGYLALYDYDRESDLVAILAIRHQREAGYEPDR